MSGYRILYRQTLQYLRGALGNLCGTREEMLNIFLPKKCTLKLTLSIGVYLYAFDMIFENLIWGHCCRFAETGILQNKDHAKGCWLFL